MVNEKGFLGITESFMNDRGFSLSNKYFELGIKL